jgi:membrane-bound lytic murein transglycosylase B
VNSSRYKISLIALVFFMAPHAAFSSNAHKKKHTKPETLKLTGTLTYAARPEALHLADEIAQRNGLDPAWVRRALKQAHFLPQVVKLMTPPPVGTVKNWKLYRSRFIDSKRIQAGVKFWEEQRSTLERAEREFGVPAEIIVGVIGVETIYGQQLGTFKTIDALATLSFDFPKNHPRAKERSEFFKSELEALLSFKLKDGIDPLSLRGSYAGALGLPQFMPSSWKRFAVDFDGNGKIDLFNSPSDAIGSVANYLKAFKWQSGMNTHYALQLDSNSEDLAYLLASDILPTHLPQEMLARGVSLEAMAVLHPGLLALVKLENGDEAPTYVAGTENFYAITRYNWSSYYAMAVIDLGQTILKNIKPR